MDYRRCALVAIEAPYLRLNLLDKSAELGDPDGRGSAHLFVRLLRHFAEFVHQRLVLVLECSRNVPAADVEVDDDIALRGTVFPADFTKNYEHSQERLHGFAKGAIGRPAAKLNREVRYVFSRKPPLLKQATAKIMDEDGGYGELRVH